MNAARSCSSQGSPTLSISVSLSLSVAPSSVSHIELGDLSDFVAAGHDLKASTVEALLVFLQKQIGTGTYLCETLTLYPSASQIK